MTKLKWALGSSGEVQEHLNWALGPSLQFTKLS